MGIKTHDVTSTASDTIRYTRNIVYNAEQGLYFDGCSTCAAYNNTIYNAGTAIVFGSHANPGLAQANNLAFANSSGNTAGFDGRFANASAADFRLCMGVNTPVAGAGCASGASNAITAGSATSPAPSVYTCNGNCDLGALKTGGAAVAPSFTFTASSPVASGSPSTLTWSVVSGPNVASTTCTPSILPGGLADANWTGLTSAQLKAGGTTPGTNRTTSTTYRMSCTDSVTTLTFLIDRVVTITVPPTLIGHWLLHETSGSTAADTSGNAQTGTLRSGGTACGNPPTTGCPTWGFSRLTLDGSNDDVRITRTAILEPPALTVCAWVTRAGAPTPYADVVNKTWNNDGSPTFTSYALQLNRGGLGEDRVTFTTGHSGTVQFLESPLGVIPDGVRTCVCGSYDPAASGSQKQLYVNGAVCSGCTATLTLPLVYNTPGAQDLYFGTNGAGRAYAGGVEDVQIYDQALSGAAIAAVCATDPLAPQLSKAGRYLLQVTPQQVEAWDTEEQQEVKDALRRILKVIDRHPPE